MSNTGRADTPVALRDHHLPGDEDLLRGALNAEVAARNHHAVGHLEDVAELLAMSG